MKNDLLQLTEEYLSSVDIFNKQQEQQRNNLSKAIGQIEADYNARIAKQNRSISELQQYRKDYGSYIAFVHGKYEELYDRDARELIASMRKQFEQLQEKRNNAEYGGWMRDILGATGKHGFNFGKTLLSIPGIGKEKKGPLKWIVNLLLVIGYVVAFGLLGYAGYAASTMDPEMYLSGFKVIVTHFFAMPYVMWALAGALGLSLLIPIVYVANRYFVAKRAKQAAEAESREKAYQSQKAVEEVDRELQSFIKENPNWFRNGTWIERSPGDINFNDSAKAGFLTKAMNASSFRTNTSLYAPTYQFVKK